MFVVTGATGQLGHAIVRRLARFVPPGRIVAVCREPGKAGFGALGVAVRRGDFADPDSLRSAFEGASQVLIVSSNARAYGGDTLAQHRQALAAAREAGADRVVYTSHMAASATSAFPPMHDHAATELMLRDCGMAWTALRHGFYGASGVAMLADALKTGTLDMAADGPVSWTAHADLAEAAALILADTARASGPTPPLTGPEALSLGDLVAIASQCVGKPIGCRLHTDDDMRATLAARGLPATVVAIAMGFYTAARNGEFSAVDATLGKLLGRPLIRMRDLLAEKAAAQAG
ncbi:MAG: NmrA family NAD(P)-binding protein [Proteobacteria bacterium]|nr:NmrA family NAD(P)-binding protein [Pseudomonadota bacterium]